MAKNKDKKIAETLTKKTQPKKVIMKITNLDTNYIEIKKEGEEHMLHQNQFLKLEVFLSQYNIVVNHYKARYKKINIERL